MKTLLLISWRNVWRNKRRSFVVIASVAIGIIGMLFTMAFMNSMTMQKIDNMINISLGHIAIHKKDFQDTMKLKYNFKPTSEIRNIVKEISQGAHVTEKIKVQGFASSSETPRGVMIVGIDPKVENKASKIYDYTIKKNGSQFLSDSNGDMILISKSIAKKMEIGIGDRLPITFQDSKNKIQKIAFFVTGLYQTPMEDFDKFVVFVGLKKLQKLTGLKNNISEINIILKDKQNVETAQKKLLAKIKRKDLEILSWKNMAPQLVKAVKTFDSMMAIFFVILFAVIVISVLNTMIMAIMERFHEIGVMKSIGTQPKQIFIMVLFEAFNLSMIGLALGATITSLVLFYWSFGGVDLAMFAEGLRDVGSGSILHPYLRSKDILLAIAVVIGTAFIAALYPAVKAARIKPLEALHYN